jgi:hypothetical protein
VCIHLYREGLEQEEHTCWKIWITHSGVVRERGELEGEKRREKRKEDRKD